MKKVSFLGLLVALVLAVGRPALADPRLEAATERIDSGDWAAAESLIAQALDAARDEAARLEAEISRAMLVYYRDEPSEVVGELAALDARARTVFGHADARRLRALLLLGYALADTGATEEAVRRLTAFVRLAGGGTADPEERLYALLDLAWIYRDAGQPATAAIIAADLHAQALETFGEDGNLAVEAAILRGFAHLDRGHLVEAVVQAAPALAQDLDRLRNDAPDLLNLLYEFHGALTAALPDGDDPAAFDRVMAEARSVIAARQARDGGLAPLQAFDAAIRAGDIAEAARLARAAVARVLADDPVPVATYVVMLLAHLSQGDPIAAAPWAARLAGHPAGFLATRDLNLIEPLSDVAAALALRGRTPEALALIAIALEVSDLHHGPESPEVQRVLLHRSQALSTVGDLAGARAAAERALAFNQDTSADPSLRAALLMELGTVATLQRDIAEAEASLRAAAAILQDHRLTEDVRWATLLQALANVAVQQQRHDEAERLLRQSVAVYEAVLGSAAPPTITARISLAVALAQTGKTDEARALYVTTREAFEAATDPDHPLRTLLMLGESRLLRRIGDEAAADAIFAAAVDLATANGTAPGIAAQILHTDLAERAWSDDRLDEAQQYLARAYAVTPEGDPNLPRLQLLDGRIALERGQPRRALGLFRGLTASLSQPGRHDLLGARDHLPLHIEAAHRAGADGDEAEALRLQAEIFAVAQGVNAITAGQALSRAAARWNTTPDLAAKVRAVQQSEDRIAGLRRRLLEALAEGADATALRTRLDAALQAYGAQEEALRAGFPDYARFANPAPVDLTAIAARLGPEEVMVLFASRDDDAVGGGSGSMILAVTSEMVLTAGTARRSDLRDLALRLRCSAALTDPACGAAAGATRGGFVLDPEPATGTGGGFDLDLAHRAYSALLGPVAEALEGKSRLIVVPDKALTAMPFHLLVTAPPAPGTVLPGASWLLRRMAVTVVPTVASFDALRTAAPRPAAAPDSFLGVGDPLIGVQQTGPVPYPCVAAGAVFAAPLATPSATLMRGTATADPSALTALAALPETRCELAQIAARFPRAPQLLLQAEATETALKSLSRRGELAQYRVLAFATHGLIAGEVGAHDAGLVLTPPPQPTAEDDGLLTTGEIAELRLDADFVILSACNTAAGDAGSDEGLSGLASAFFYAGARSLLVSHWPVYSDAAAALTTRTFGHLDSDRSLGRADALRLAMLDLLDDPESDPRQQHPAYWGPFMIIGEGGGR